MPLPPFASRIRAIAVGYPELIAVLAAAIVGLTVQRPLAWLAGHQGINVLLAILVFATAVTIDPCFRGLPRSPSTRRSTRYA